MSGSEQTLRTPASVRISVSWGHSDRAERDIVGFDHATPHEGIDGGPFLGDELPALELGSNVV